MRNDEPGCHGGSDSDGKLRRVPHQPSAQAPPLPALIDTETDTTIADTDIRSALRDPSDITGCRDCTWNEPSR